MDTENKNNLSPETPATVEAGRDPSLELKSDLEKLRLYTQVKFELAGQAAQCKEALTALGRETPVRRTGGETGGKPLYLISIAGHRNVCVPPAEDGEI